MSQAEDQLKETALTLSDWDFKLWEKSGPDTEYFGNWILIAGRDNLALRLIGDRGHVNVDLMPVFLFKDGAPECEWYTWDVVASALGIPLRPEIEGLIFFQDHRDDINRAFAPENWKATRQTLARVEQEKRRRFTEGRKVPAHA